METEKNLDKVLDSLARVQINGAHQFVEAKRQFLMLVRDDKAAAVAAERKRCAPLDAELQAVLDWARTEKAPLRDQEIASIVRVLSKYRA